MSSVQAFQDLFAPVPIYIVFAMISAYIATTVISKTKAKNDKEDDQNDKEDNQNEQDKITQLTTSRKKIFTLIILLVSEGGLILLPFIKTICQIFLNTASHLEEMNFWIMLIHHIVVIAVISIVVLDMWQKTYNIEKFSEQK